VTNFAAALLIAAEARQAADDELMAGLRVALARPPMVKALKDAGDEAWRNRQQRGERP
jgi:hypothetical protein